ncbi:Ig-like domain-containing protein, partial [Zhongshania guokunii]
MAAKQIGFIAEIVGSATVRSAEGIVRVVNVGDGLREGDLLMTGLNSTVLVTFYDGHQLQVEADARILMDETLAYDGEGYGDLDVDQIAALQQAILDGLDLSELEPTAAGVQDVGVGDGLGASSEFQRDGREGIVDTRLTPISGDSDTDELDFQGLGGSSRNSSQSDQAKTSISLNEVAVDGVVNAAELGSALVISGAISGEFAEDRSITINIGGKDYDAIINADDSSFSVTVPAADVSELTGGTVTATLISTDDAGNSLVVDTSRPFTVDKSSAASISVDNITADDIVNAVEAGGNVDVSGSVGLDAGPGDTVSMTINGRAYSGVVQAGNTYSIPVAGSDLVADTRFEATVTGADSAGNPFTATTISTHTVDTSSTATITVDNITADDIVNAAEAGGNVNVTGSVGPDAGPGDTVSLTVNGTEYSGVVQADNTYSIPVAGSDLAADASFETTVTGTDEAGNPFTIIATSTHTVDTESAATIAVDSVTADDIVNAAEAGGTINVTGLVGGDAKVGDTVSFTINGTTYTGVVQTDNTFSVAVAGSDLAAQTNFVATVTGSDSAGNPFTATTLASYTVDTTATATVTVDSITADDVVSAAEAGGIVNVTGSVGGDASVGDTVSFTVNGTAYTGTVQTGNVFSVAVAGSDLAADTSFDVTVVGTDDIGNSFIATTTSTYTVDTEAAAAVTVDSITADDVINAVEAGGTVNVTGSVGGDATVGAAVSVTINGTVYSGTVQAGNIFSIAVAGSDLAADTSVDVTVAGSDSAGNPYTATSTSIYTVDTDAAAAITVDSITADDVINAAEAGSTINVTGSVGGDAAEGATVSFTINGRAYTGTVQAGNTFSVAVAGADLAAGSSFDATVTGSDSAGNPFTATTTSTYTVDTTATASITVDSITPDDVLSAAEAGGTINVTGSVGGDAAVGATVSFAINGTVYTGTVQAGNTFSVAVAGSDLAAATSFDATVTGSDSAGNLFTATTTSSYTVDTTATATVIVDSITADDVISAAEAGGTINVTGSVGGDATVGSTVSFTINGTVYSGTVQAGNVFSVAVAGSDLAADTSFDVTVTGSDGAGNPFTATTTSSYTVDTTAAASIIVDSITPDDVVSAAEAGGNVIVTGSVGGDATAGATVNFTINGSDYSATVQPGNTFSVAVAGSDLVADTSFVVSVTGSDGAGNPFTASTTSTHIVDTSAAASVALNTIATDDIVNAVESASDLVITGLVSGDAAAGDTVMVSVGGKDYLATVNADNASFAVAIPAADVAALTGGNVTATLSGTDDAGNSFTASSSRPFTVDTTTTASISVDNITSDDVVSAAEAATNINVTGSVSGDATVGDTVSFTVNGTDYSGVVQADNTFSIPVAGADLAADTSFELTVTGSDSAGNSFTATAASTHTVDSSAAATITVNSITADDIVSAAEVGASINVTGAVSGDAAVGDTVSFTVNGNDYSGTVQADNTYSIAVSGVDLAADTSFDIVVTGSDNASNPFTASITSTHTVDTTAAATIAVDNITSDDVLNAAEAGGNINVTGSVGGDAAEGDTVTVTINGNSYSATVQADNSFGIVVAGADLAADTSFDATVVGNDAAGNPFTATTTSNYIVDTTAAANIIVDSITADNVVNAAEAGTTVNVTGSVGGDATVGDTVSFTINGTNYSGIVQAGNTFGVAVAGSDLAADTSFEATVIGTDNAGNPFTASTTSTFTVDTAAAGTITVDSITADDVVSAAEAGGTINVTGSVGGDAAVGDTVSFTINGTAYSGTVQAGNTYSVAVAGADLAAATSFDATVAGTDTAGNPFTATTISTYTVDTTAAVSVTVDSITADDIVSAAEAGGTINVTGSVGGDAAIGDIVSFTINGTDYSGTVQAGNTFSIAVAGSDLAAQTAFDATVVGTDNAGNPFTATTTSTYTVDTAAAASITVNSITADDIISAAEAGGAISVTGSVGGDAAVGDTVSFTINGTAYSGTVQAGNIFNITVAGSDLAADTSFDATVVGLDNAGNPFTATTTSTHTVDTAAAATITVDSITADDVVNAVEAGGTIDVTGSVGGDAAVGDTISFTINGTNYSGTVQAGNTFSIAVAGSDLAADTAFDATVAGTDNAGNPFTATTTSTYTVDTSAAATITVDSITADDVVNAVEAGGAINVTGSVGGDAAAGDTVSITVNGTDYSGTVQAGNTYSIAVAGADLAADNSFDAIVTGTDSAGNPFTASTTSTHGIDTASSATIVVDNITADDVVNAAEAGGAIDVTGSVGGDAAIGDIVNFTVNGTDYSGTVQAGNTFSIAVAGSDLAADTSFDVTVAGTDSAGNPFTASTTSTHAVDTSAAATIAVDSITADDVVSAAEAGGTIDVTGSVAGDAAVGDTVSLTINGNDYSGIVQADNTFSIAVAGADLAADTSFDATVTGTDGAGNPFTATTTSIHSVDTSAAATINVDSITPDDVLNAAEAGGTVNVTGSVGGDAAVGDTVSFTINGTNYSGTVQAGNTFSVAVAGADLAAGTSFDATVVGADNAGNPFTATTTSTYLVDTTAAATITVDDITADDVVNAAESGATINVTGSVGGDAAVGDTVSFTVNGTVYTGTVQAGNTYSVAVAGSDLAADTSFDVTVTGTDSAGNPFTASTTSTHAVDTSAAATIAVDSITADDVVNAAEAGGTIDVTGVVTGDAAADDTVSVTINGNTYSGTVQADNSFTIAVAGADLAADTSLEATVTGTDDAGNSFTATTTSTHTVDTASTASISVDDITADDVVNAAEAGATINVTGSVGGDATVGDTVSFTVNGTNYSGTVLAGNTYSIAVSGADLAADNSFDVTVTGSDNAGNPFTAITTSSHAVDTTAAATISVDSITADDVINAAEAGATINITGSVSGDAAPGDAVSFTVNGTDYSGTVLADNSFSIAVSGVDLAADTSFDATVTGTDGAGNPFTASTTSTHSVDITSSAAIVVDSITADDVVNAAEAGGIINVTGSVSGDATVGDTVSFSINGTDYSGTVQAGSVFSIAVAGTDLAADTSFDATVVGTDNAGNPFTATTTSTHISDASAAATITVDSITADDVLSAAEAGGTINVTGSVGGDAAPGDSVSFTVNGTDYSGIVQAGNTYSIAVAGSDLAADTSFDVSVSGSDGSGNPFTATSTSTHTVDATATATIIVDSITPDDVVNAAEAGATIHVTGSVGGDATVGDTVSFTVNGTDYSGTVQAGNTYSIAVAGSDLLADTSFDATVVGTDNAGNPFTASTTSTHSVDISSAASVALDAIATDDIINAVEAGADLTISGTVGGDAVSGDSVVVSIGGNDYAATVNADNITFSVTVPATDVAALTAGNVTATLTGSDDAGNPFTATSSRPFTVDTAATATISVDNITADDVVSAAEAGGTINVTGSVGGDAGIGDTVSFTINGTDYSGAVQAGNTFSIAVAGSDLAADTSFDASVAGSDDAGNPFTATTTSTHTVDNVAGATIVVDDITADDVLNAAEAGATINVTGTVGGDAAPGDTVSFTINGTPYSGTVLAGNTYSIAVDGADLAADTSFDATVTGTDAAGNPFTATTTSTHTVDTSAAATITVNDITADDVVNAAEAGTSINVTGTVGGDAAPGDTVSFTINGTPYSGIVLAGNTYSIAVNGADLAADTSFDATVTGTDAAGNSFTATTTSNYTVDTTAAATIIVDSITADDVVNAAEAGGTINVTGSVGGDAAPGDTVSFTINGGDYSGIVQPGNTYSIAVAGSDLAADTSFDATVVGTDNAGNPFTASTTSTHIFDATAAATITVDSITADDVVSAAEAGGTINVTGSVGGDAAPGDTVSFTVNGNDYSGIVQSGNTYSIAVAGADLAADTSFDASVTGSDDAGNPFTATTTSTHISDVTASATIAVDSITADDVVSAAEAGSTINVTGSVGGDAAPGDAVSFTINGTNYSGTVQAGNTFSIAVAGTDLAADTSFDATVTGADNAGNPFTASSTSTHSVDTSAAATIALAAIAADDIINAAEAGTDLIISGTVGGDAASGDSVIVSIGGKDYAATVNADNTSFSVTVPAADVAALSAGSATAVVTGSDDAGNSFTANDSRPFTVDTIATATITVDNITADDVVNAVEAGGSIDVTGTVGGDAAVGDTVSFTINGTPYSGTVQAGNTFTIAVAGADLAADTSFAATVTGSDAAGNAFTATTTSTHTVDAAATATITVNDITPDDVVNAAEAGTSIDVTGTVGGDAAPGDTVSFTINGTPYSGTVLAGNTYSIAVAGSDLAADTSFDVSVTGTDAAGNPFTATTSSSHTVDTSAAATVTVDNITSDDVVNAAEAGANINVTGTVGGDASAGDTVSFTVNGTPYSGIVLAGNTYSIAVAGADLAADTSFDVTVTGTDGAGNPFTATATSTHTVDTASAATITVDSITADDVVNAVEAGTTINITGSVGGDAAPGDTVSFTINGTRYSGTVLAGNTFSIPVAGSDLAAQTSFDATVAGSDAAGNSFIATTTSTHSVDTSAAATISVDAITPDDIVNAAEAGTTINVTGSVGGDAAPGDTVSFTINGTPYSGTVLAGNTYSIAVDGADLAADTSFDATVTGTDAAGNPFTAITTSTHTVDTAASATIAVNDITADDIVNAAEAGTSINVTGTVGGDAAPGDIVSFTINGTPYSGTVLAGNTYSIAVDGADLAADTSFAATVTGTDAAGNPFTATTTSTHTVDTTASATITVNDITPDDIVNAAEAGTSINVTGTVGGDATVGDTVSFTINGTPYSGTVLAGNTYSIAVDGADLAADTSFDATVAGTDAAGNPFTATTTSTHTVDTSATATITVNDITPDDIVNAAEAGSTIDVTGTVGGDAAPGDTVSFTINGTSYSGTVLAGNTYSIAVDGADLAANTSFDATVTGTDEAGNPFTATTTSTHTVDTMASATITVNDITPDDIVNAAEAGGTIDVTGTVGGDAAPGDTVSFTINGTPYSGTVLAGNTYSIAVAGSDLAAQTSFDATVTGTDAAGNPFTATTTSTHTVDTSAAATITVNDITPDDIVNAAEAGTSINVTGSVGGDAAPGDTVSFTINGTPYSGTVLAGNTYSIAVDGADLAADTSFDATVTGTDATGNPFTATTTSTHTVDTTASATITVND